MPITTYLDINIGGSNAFKLHVADNGEAPLSISYTLEDVDNWENKGGANGLMITAPVAQDNNDTANGFYNPSVTDTSYNNEKWDNQDIYISCNGVLLFQGTCILTQATHDYYGREYQYEIFGGNADWVQIAQNMSLWDTFTDRDIHTWNDGTIQASWNYDGTDPSLPYCYIPVRYRQPWGMREVDQRAKRKTLNNTSWGVHTDSGIPNCVITPYHLRPSWSIYWRIYNGLQMMGYKLSSAFMDTDFFRRLVLLWTWGNFFDQNSQLEQVVAFRACGYNLSNPPNDAYAKYYYIDPTTNEQSYFYDDASVGIGGVVRTQTIGGQVQKWLCSNTNQPQGYNNNGNYSFDESTGRFQWRFNNIPTSLNGYFAGRQFIPKFRLNLLCALKAVNDIITGGSNVKVYMNCIYNGGAAYTYTDPIIQANSGSGDVELLYTTSPYVYEFVPLDSGGNPIKIQIGDQVEFYLTYTFGGAHWHIYLIDSVWSNSNYIDGQAIAQNLKALTTGWTLYYTSLELIGFYIDEGATVDPKNYDAFRNYQFLDLLRGLVDCFNLIITTDPIEKKVTIEPQYGAKDFGSGADFEAYYTEKYLDWTQKQDVSKENTLVNYKDSPRIIDFSYKNDGNDGATKLYMERYKGLYTQVKKWSWDRLQQSVDDGLKGAMPNAARFLLPERYQRGNKKLENRFFSPLMHYMATEFRGANLTLGHGTAKTPQIPILIPQNITENASESLGETFEPKMAYYKGLVNPDDYGTVYYNGAYDPAQLINLPQVGGGLLYPSLPENPKSATPTVALPSFPMAFQVNYTGVTGSSEDPILSYCDQYLESTVKHGLMRRFFGKRMATMREGKLYHAWIKLDYNDVTNWEHREAIIINGIKYRVVAIENYEPNKDQSTKVTLWKEGFVTDDDVAHMYPSENSVITQPVQLNDGYDLLYRPSLIFQSDIPNF